MYIFELADIMFFIKSLKTPTSNFNIISYLYVYSAAAQLGPSSSGFKSIHNFHQTIKLGDSISTDSHGYGTHAQILGDHQCNDESTILIIFSALL